MQINCNKFKIYIEDVITAIFLYYSMQSDG